MHSSHYRQILGINFYVGDLKGLLDRTADGGLIVVPSAPVLVDLAHAPAHREAVEGSDFAITDSGFMVLLWLLFHRERLTRISGLRFLRGLLGRPEFHRPGATFWVMPSPEDAKANAQWLTEHGVPVGQDQYFVAPHYPAGRLKDAELLARIEARKPAYVVLGLGGGVQERLGYYLRAHLSYRPAILCTGAAIAFLSGRQASIPVWADRMMLGWLFRTVSDPARFIPRFVKALKLAPLLWKCGVDGVAGSEPQAGRA